MNRYVNNLFQDKSLHSAAVHFWNVTLGVPYAIDYLQIGGAAQHNANTNPIVIEIV